MKYQIMIDILFTLLAKRKVSAAHLAGRHDISVRTVYRYIDEMTCAGIPIDVARGANGGIFISDTFKLPKGLMTREEYARAVDAMLAMLDQTGDEVLRAAVEKLSAQMKAEKYDSAISGNILVDSGAWGVERRISDKITAVEKAIEECEALEIDYVGRSGERSRRTVQPYLLIYKQYIWYMYAFCLKRGDFRTFKIGRIRSILTTGEHFEKQPFSRDDIPLSFWPNGENTVEARFSISPEALPFAEEWLGIENVYEREGAFYADVTLPDDESLLGKILSVGAGFEVLSPSELRNRVKKEAEKVAASYK